MAVRLQLLGSPALDGAGGPTPLPFERRTQLLAFLAMRRTWVGRAELAAMLWPDQAEALAYTNLRKTLFRLRSLPWSPEVEAQGSALRYIVPTDVEALEAALAAGDLAQAARLRRGELLAGYEDPGEAWSGWLDYERSRLRAAWRTAALAYLDGEREPAEAIDLSARLLEEDPFDEAALRQHLAWLVRDGQAARARQAYREFSARLADELQLAPGAELRALHDAIDTTPEPPPAPAPPEDGFIGRAVELRQLSTLLADGACRLVCVLGPGGVGKTRLVRRALDALAGRFADGAAFVALEEASVAADIAGAIARALGLALADRMDPLQQVVEALRGRDLALVLDNFEHLLAEVPFIERLLRDCPRVKLVVTSRVRLGLVPEQLLPLDGLPFPDEEDRDRFEAFDAVRLFVNAARRVDPGFVADSEAIPIVEICRHLDGLPLAIELAAAWVRVMPCEAIAAQLREGPAILEAQAGERPPRHSSMQRVLDETWRLLAPAERDALAALSVFEAAFSADAARAVTSVPLPVLGALVDKSLLRRERGRLAMHPLLRQLAAERLAASDAREQTHRAHAQHFLRLLAQARRGLADGDRDALARVELDFADFRAAWRWASGYPLRAAVQGAVLSLLSFCDHRLRLEEGLALLQEAIEAPLAVSEPRLEALLVAASAHLLYRMDRYGEAEAAARRALEATAPEDDDARLQCFKVLGACALRLGRHAEAGDWFGQALALKPAEVDPHNAAAMLDNLALVEKYLGRYEESLRLSGQSLVQHRLLRDTAGEALCLNNLASLQMDMRDFAGARARLLEGLAVCERHGLAGTQALILANLTEAALELGDLDAAEDYGQRALEGFSAAGNRGVAAWLRMCLGRVAVAAGRMDDARAHLAACLETAIAIGQPSLQFAGISCFAELLRGLGEADGGRRVLEFCAAHPAIGARDRDVMRARLGDFPPAAGSLAWPSLSLEELVHRIVLERSVEHRPLIELLRTP